MAQDNHISLTGNITRDPELRFTPSGAAVAEFGLAWNQRKKDGQGGYEDVAHFFDVVVWQELAEHVTDSIGKGARVTVTGRLDWSSWEDKDTGDKRSKVRIVADEVSPSLRWATAQVTKAERGDGGGGNDRGSNRGGGRDRDDRGGRGSSGGGRGGSGGGRGRDESEEPF